MGKLRDALKLREDVDRVRLELGSPWADGQLAAVAWAELYPTDNLPITRGEAMRVPAVAAARHRIVTGIATMPLAAYRDGQRLDDQPVWTYRADTTQSPALRLAYTADDLLFHGESLWLVDRDSEGWPIRAAHVPFDVWGQDDAGHYLIDDQRIPDGRALHIPGLHEGLLSFGSPAIRGAHALLDAAVDTAKHPFRLELHDTGEYPMTDDEARALVADARAALADGYGVVYTTPGLESKLHSYDTGALLVDGRESFAVDVARLAGIPAAMIDAHSRGATMTYQTTRDVIEAFLHLGLPAYMLPITARLSSDDIAPRGTEIRFDTAAILTPEALVNPAAAPSREPTTPQQPPAPPPPAGDESPTTEA